MIDGLPELMFAHKELVAEVHAHNCAVIIRRQRGAYCEAPENQYRNAVTEVLALRDKADG